MLKNKLFIVVTLALTGCVTNDDNIYHVKSSSLPEGYQANSQNLQLSDANSAQDKSDFTRIKRFSSGSVANSGPTDISLMFSDSDTVEFVSDSVPLKQLFHSVLHDILGVNYVIEQTVSALEAPVTLNFSGAISKRRAFKLFEELLLQQGVAIAYNDGVFYLSSSEDGSKHVEVGFGRSVTSVPQSGGRIMQILPLKFGSNLALERSIGDVANISVSSDLEKGYLFLKGNRADILRALELVNILDSVSERGRHIAMIRLTYVTVEEFSKKVVALMAAEGIPNISIGVTPTSNLVLVPVEHIGGLVAFTAEETLLERVQFWATQLDVPSEGPEKRYFIYNPRFSRAADLGGSLASLIAPGSSNLNQQRDTSSAMVSQPSNTNSASARAGSSNRSANRVATQSVTVQGEKLSMTVDERSNSLVFYATGKDYQSILPMIQRLDTMPKQVLLEAVIAEVTLTDEFAYGVEFAIKNGSFGIATKGALGVTGISGLSVSYIKGLDDVLGKLKGSKSLVNVLSNPSIVVRDGVEASMSVGDDIPTISSTTSAPLESDRQTTSISYRKTGLEFSVLPTINAQGLVVMEIKQKISNALDGSTIEGSPAIFERTIDTEVIAESGQTILLGGLISERNTQNDSATPGFSKIPLLGQLFKGESDKKVKTELILLITAKVIDDSNQWNYITDQIQKGFTNLKFGETR